MAASAAAAPADTEALADILPRASSPWERAHGRWLTPGSAARVDERLDAWARAAASGSVDELRLLLARRDMGGVELTRALSDARLDRLGASDVPGWASAIARLVAAGRRGGTPPPIRARDVVDPGELPEGTPPDAPWRFEDACRPWLGAAAEALDREIAAGSVAVAPEARVGLVAGVAGRWHEVLTRPLLEPVAIADLARGVPARAGGSVQEAFLGDAAGVDDWLRLWTAYPGAARLMAVALELWRANVRRMLRRIARDAGALAGADGALGALTACRFAGDPHEGHQCVALLGFASGVEVAYKPRPLAPAACYARAYGELTGDPYEPCGRMLTRPGYGWQALANARPCRDERQLRRYFRRVGTHARLLELFDAVDIHGENVVAAGDRPVLIDLETLLTPRFEDAATARLLRASPLSTGLISMKARGMPGRRAPDLGSLAAPGWAGTPWDVLTPDPATGSVVRREGRFRVATALPVYDSEYVPPDAYEEELVAGYVELDRRLRARGAAWLRRRGAAEAAQLRTRFVHRETRFYAHIMTASVSAAALRDGIARELVLETLWRPDLASTKRAWALVSAEVDALRQLDIPLFRSDPATRDVLVGDRRVRNCLELPPLEDLERRVAALAERRTAPADGIRAALFVRDPLARRNGLPPSSRPPDPVALGRRILALALPAGAAAPPAWFGLHYEAAYSCWSLGSLGGDLMTGTSGFAAVLADLWRRTGDRQFHAAAARLVAAAPELVGGLAATPAHPAAPAACTPAGAVYALHRAATVLGVGAGALEALAADALDDTLPAAAAWILALSGCHVASHGLDALRRNLAQVVRERLDDLAVEPTGGLPGPEGGFVQMSPFGQALVGLQRLSRLPGSSELAPPPAMLVELARSPRGHESLAVHALRAARGFPQSVGAELEAAARRPPPHDAPPLEHCEHALARAWSFGDAEGRSAAIAALARWRADARAPERFDLGALGGLACACHLALRIHDPSTIAPLRTCAPMEDR